MNDQISDLILTELRDMRKEMNNGFSDMKERVTAVETQTQPFFETGGGLQNIHSDLESLKRVKYIAIGGAGVISTLIHGFLHKLGY